MEGGTVEREGIIVEKLYGGRRLFIISTVETGEEKWAWKKRKIHKIRFGKPTCT